MLFRSILLLIPVLDRYEESPLTKGVFYGLRPTSAALITAALLGFIKMVLFNSGLVALSEINLINLILLLAFIGLIKLKVLHPILVIALGAVLGMVFQLV